MVLSSRLPEGFTMPSNRYSFGKKRAPDCVCTHRFTCGPCLRDAGPTLERPGCLHERVKPERSIMPDTNATHTVGRCASCYALVPGVTMRNPALDTLRALCSKGEPIVEIPQRHNVLCGCGWGRLAMPRHEIPDTCPMCGRGMLHVGTLDAEVDP